MSLSTRCRRCGREYDLDRAAILAGTWRLCPSCRTPPGGAAGQPPDLRPTAKLVTPTW